MERQQTRSKNDDRFAPPPRDAHDGKRWAGQRGKWKNEVHPLYFFIFDSVKKRRKNKATCKIKILQPKAERFCALFEAVASSQKRFQRERFIPLDTRKRPRTYGKCYDSAATRSGLSKHVTRFSYPSPDRTQSIKKVVLVLTNLNYINAKGRTNRCGRMTCDTWIRAPFFETKLARLRSL